VIQIGDSYSEKIVFTQNAVNTYIELIGDTNPIHTDLSAAQEAGYTMTIIPGMFAASMFDHILGPTFPGHGSINLYRAFTFIRPVFVDIEYTISVQVMEIPEGGIAIIKCTLKDLKGRICIECSTKIKNAKQFILRVK
jgi:acyl dehydratase